MFNYNNLTALLKARPFVPFRFIMSDGSVVEVKSPEFVWPGRQFANVAILDPTAPDTLVEWFTTVWYMHVTRIEFTQPGAPPFTSPAGPAESSTPSPA